MTTKPQTVESIIASLKSYGKLNETTYVQQSRIDFWGEQLRLICADRPAAAIARLNRHDADYHDAFAAIAQSVLNRRNRAWSLDKQLNDIQRIARQWIKPDSSKFIVATAMARCHARLAIVADKLEGDR